MSSQEITANELLSLIDKEAVKLVDVRTPGEFSSSHIPSSVNIPLSSEAFKDFKNTEKTNNEKIILICQGGVRAKTAFDELIPKNKLTAYVLSGGVNSWQKSGYDMVIGDGPISMERQVRIAAGLFVFLGSVLSLIFSSGLVLIPMFIGAGLVFSGVTNTCGMARVLALMPWNNRI